MKKILVPIDFSKESEKALEAAVEIADFTGASITLLHVVESLNDGDFLSSAADNHRDAMDNLYVLKCVEKAQKDLHELIDRHRSNKIHYFKEIKVGNPVRQILLACEKEQIDLIIMGSKGSNSLAASVIGSNTDKIVRSAKSLVLTVKDNNERINLRNVVLATNLKDDAAGFIQRLKELQNIFGFKLHILYVNTPSSFSTTEDIEEKAKHYARKFELENYDFSIVNEYFEIRGIMYFSEKIKADLVAMSTHGRRGIAHLFVESISEDMVNKSQKPILTFNTHL